MIEKYVVNNKKKININIKKILLLILLIGTIVGIYWWGTSIKSNKIRYSIYDHTDIGFLGTTKELPTKYQLVESYEEYYNIINTIDQWAEDVLNTIEHPYLNIESYEGKSESYKEKVIESKNKEFRKFYKEEYLDDIVELIKEKFEEANYTPRFFEKNSLLLVEDFSLGVVVHEQKPEDICVNGNVLTVHFLSRSGGCVGGGDGILHLITIPKRKLKDVNKIEISMNNENTSVPGMAYKPIIYLYPTKDTNVEVRLGNKENITVSYPKYIDGWNVLAKPSGELTDLKTNRELYALYYENTNSVCFEVTKDGFVIKGTDSATFLEEKLKLLGLNEREAEEFIIYWLPVLESNKYNYIRFATNEEINKNMPLEITPKPDSIIRVLMTFKGLEEPINVNEQKIIPPAREKFTVVEWGGTEIK